MPSVVPSSNDRTTRPDAKGGYPLRGIQESFRSFRERARGLALAALPPRQRTAADAPSSNEVTEHRGALPMDVSGRPKYPRLYERPTDHPIEESALQVYAATRCRIVALDNPPAYSSPEVR